MKRFFLLLATLALLAAPGCGPVRTLQQAQQADRQAQQADRQAQQTTQTNRQPAPGEPEEIVTHETVTLTYSFRDCDIMNPGARLFLEQVDYSDDPGFTRTDVNRPEFAEANDRPRPVRISWEGGRASSVLLATDPLFKDARTIAADADSPVEIYNLVPGVDYYYKVLSGAQTLKQGGVTPVGPLRMICTYQGARPRHAVYNVRDLGGWKTADGRRHIAYGKLYRGSNIDHLNDDPYAKDVILNQLGASIDFDLRGYKGDANDPHIDGLTYYQLPLRKNFEGGTGQTERLYKKAIRQILGWLDEGRVVYFHCAAGADRTGTLAFLIEALLGVGDSDLSKDFEITSFDRFDWRTRIPREDDPTHTIGLLIPYLRSGQFGEPSRPLRELVYNWATSETQDDLGNEYVAPLTAEEIARLRSHLLVD